MTTRKATQRTRDHAISRDGRPARPPYVFEDIDEDAPLHATDTYEETDEWSDDGGEVETWLNEHHGRRTEYSDLL